MSSRGDPRARSRAVALLTLLPVLGVLVATLGTTAFSAAATAQSRVAGSLIPTHSVESGKDSGAGRLRCAQPPHRGGGPDDHKIKTVQDGEKATSTRIFADQPVAAQFETSGIAPPERIVLRDALPTAERYEYHAYRTFDGRAPPRAMS
ncbi:MAG: hypothetical protein GEU97_18890 [Actinophytocola sp.]|nr:hypothetical protein [Actinophytocola sp.]